MSIRSIVAIGVTKEHEEKLLSFIDRIGIPDESRDGDGQVVIKYDQIKWYDYDDSAVKDLMDWLSSLPDNKWGFIEIYSGDEGIEFNIKGTPYDFDISYSYDISIG